MMQGRRPADESNPMRTWDHWCTRAIRIILLLVAVISIVSIVAVEVALQISYLLYALGTTIALIVAFRGRFSWFYFAFAIFICLGLFGKSSIHQVLEVPLSEPIGEFYGTADEWEQYYQFGAAILFGMIVGRIGTVMLRVVPTMQRYVRGLEGQGPITGGVWVLVAGLIVATYTVNSAAGFFVTGIEPSIRLPLGLNAPFAFMAFIGLAILVAFLVGHDYLSRGALSGPALAILLLQGAAASVSMASRAAFVMQTVPVMLAVIYERIYRRPSGVSARAMLAVAFLVLLVVLVLVTAYRITHYYGTSVFDPEVRIGLVLETTMLPFRRWVGAEGIMVAVANSGSSLSLLWELMIEDPVTGVASTYQVLAGATYFLLGDRTFLTLPGLVGVLALSGSLTVCFVGAILVVFVGSFLERICGHLIRQRICLALVSTAIANSFAQISFPRLLIWFVFQLLIICLVIWAMRVKASPRPAVQSAY